MGSSWLWWVVLSSLTGSPIGSALFLVVVWWAVDRFTLGVLPDPLRWLGRWKRSSQLERALLLNPHDGRARLELGGLLLERRRYTRALEVVKPNAEKGDHDAQTLFVLGAACVGAGYAEQGEKLLDEVEATSPGFRVGEVDLVRGRFRLARGDFRGAKEALQRLVQARQGTVEGRVLLAKALDGMGDDGAAALMRDQAWSEFVAAPRFQRRQERLWAWRARPSRPVLYVLCALAALGVGFALLRPLLASWAPPAEYD